MKVVYIVLVGLLLIATVSSKEKSNVEKLKEKAGEAKDILQDSAEELKAVLVKKMHEVHEEYEKLLASAKEVPAEKLAEMKEKLGEFAEYYLPKKEPEGFKDKIAHKASQFKEWVGSVVDGIMSSNESEDKAQKEQAKHQHDDKEKQKKSKEEHEEKEREDEEHVGIIKGAYETLSNWTHDAFGKLKNLTGTAAENVTEEAKRQAHEKVNVGKLENITEGIKEGAKNAYEAVKNFGSEKLVNANETLHAAKDMYHNVKETAGEKINKADDYTKEKMTDVKEAAGEKINKAADYTKEKMADATESIANMAEYSLDSMKNAVDYVITHAKHLSKEQMKKLREMFKQYEL